MSKADVNRRRYHERKDQGLCPLCGCARDIEGGNICSRCLAFRRRDYANRRAKQTMEKRIADNERIAKCTRARQRRYREQGLCGQCGRPSPDHWLCERCRERQSLNAKRRAKEGTKKKEWEAQHEDA